MKELFVLGSGWGGRGGIQSENLGPSITSATDGYVALGKILSLSEPKFSS